MINLKRQLAAPLLALAAAPASFFFPPASPAQTARNPHAAQLSTRDLDLRIARAEARLAAAGATEADRAAAAEAYLARGNVYYEAGTPSLYKFALGDYRRALRHRPNLSEARGKAEQITSVYESMGRPVPTNGDEPAERLEEMLAKAERLTFAGEPAAAGAAGEIARGAVRDYVIALPAGRRVRVKLTPAEGPARNPVSFNFYEARDGAPIRVALGATDWSGDVERESQYVVRVGPLTHGARYRLEVTHDRAAETRKF
jgi:hypothetical protein